MRETDLEVFRVRCRELSDEAVAELHAAGAGAYLAQAWVILEAEFHGRGHPACAAPREPPTGPGERPT